MLNPMQNSLILTTESDDPFLILLDRKHVIELGIKARMRYESEPIFKSIHTVDWWLDHFGQYRRVELLDLCRTLGILRSKKATYVDLKIDLAHYFYGLVNGRSA